MSDASNRHRKNGAGGSLKQISADVARAQLTWHPTPPDSYYQEVRVVRLNRLKDRADWLAPANQKVTSSGVQLEPIE